MAEIAIISKTDVNVYRQIDTKICDDRFNAYVMDIQRRQLRDLFGQALYYAFMADARTSGIYADLQDGKTYTYNSETVEYYGIKPLLCYWYLALQAREGELFHSSYGAIELVNNPQQNFEKAKEKERIAAQYMETAQTYANDVIQFLNQNSADYSLWNLENKQNKTNFVSFRI